MRHERHERNLTETKLGLNTVFSLEPSSPYDTELTADLTNLSEEELHKLKLAQEKRKMAHNIKNKNNEKTRKKLRLVK